jgi:hypothetical protein
MALDYGTVRRALAEQRLVALKVQVDAAIARARVDEAAKVPAKVELGRSVWIWGSMVILAAVGMGAVAIRRRKSLRTP